MIWISPEGGLMIETGRVFWLLIQSAIPEGFMV
jgi:hypothetical protein